MGSKVEAYRPRPSIERLRRTYQLAHCTDDAAALPDCGNNRSGAKNKTGSLKVRFAHKLGVVLLD
jgi:hypothetical protein|tara:strand:+ start:197 stop:391 length:195 start_codon:yes stop_codon:yes gene_type:complete